MGVGTPHNAQSRGRERKRLGSGCICVWTPDRKGKKQTAMETASGYLSGLVRETGGRKKPNQRRGVKRDLRLRGGRKKGPPGREGGGRTATSSTVFRQKLKPEDV